MLSSLNQAAKSLCTCRDTFADEQRAVIYAVLPLFQQLQMQRQGQF